MLIFQVNPNELTKDQEITGKDWLFWNTYISEHVKNDDYALLPAWIDFITDTNDSNGQQQFLVELDDGEYDEGLDN